MKFASFSPSLSHLPLCKSSTLGPNTYSGAQGLKAAKATSSWSTSYTPWWDLPNVYIKCSNIYWRRRLKPPPTVKIKHPSPNTLCAYSKQLWKQHPRKPPTNPTAFAHLCWVAYWWEHPEKPRLPDVTWSRLTSPRLCPFAVGFSHPTFLRPSCSPPLPGSPTSVVGRRISQTLSDLKSCTILQAPIMPT